MTEFTIIALAIIASFTVIALFSIYRKTILHIISIGSLDEIAQQVRDWQDVTFLDATPLSCANHLVSEAAELAKAPTDPQEIADCFMLVVCTAHKAGINLEGAVREKLAVNKKRKWGKVNEQGFVEHERMPSRTFDEHPFNGDTR